MLRPIRDVVLLSFLLAGSVRAQAVFVNELHYDNASTDSNEAIEIAGPSGTSLTGWSIALYNGNGGTVYSTINLSGAIPNQCVNFGAVSVPVAGIQNGSPDGLALVNGLGQVIQFLSYEGTILAADGPAAGMTSTDIGIAEDGTGLAEVSGADGAKAWLPQVSALLQWLDPGIARQVLQIMETAASTPSRVLPTGFMPMPLMPDEESILSEVAASACTDGVCMVDPSFVRKLKRFARAASE